MSRRFNYARLSAAELSAALEALDISMRQFSKLCGASEDRVKDWLRDREDIPHHIGVLVCVLTLPGAMPMARRYTERMALKADELEPVE